MKFKYYFSGLSVLSLLTVFSLTSFTALAVTGKIRASLYAVPVDNSTLLGRTKITWSVSDNSYAQVWVSVDGGAEALFTCGTSAGSARCYGTTWRRVLCLLGWARGLYDTAQYRYAAGAGPYGAVFDDGQGLRPEDWVSR